MRNNVSRLFVAGMRPCRRRVIHIVAAARMIHGMLTRSAAAAMTPAPPMQRKAILLPVIAVRAVLTLWSVAVLLLRLRLLSLRLTAGDERRQPVDIALIVRTGVLRPRLKMLLLLLRLIVLRLIVL